MIKLIPLQLFLNFAFLLVSLSVHAHQPVLVTDSDNTAEAPYIIAQPEISKAIFSELKGNPHCTLESTVIQASNFIQV